MEKYPPFQYLELNRSFCTWARLRLQPRCLKEAHTLKLQDYPSSEDPSP